MDFAGRRVIVTGATHGIGKAIALSMARGGAAVASMSLPDPTLRDELLRELGGLGVRAIALQGNTGCSEDIARLAAAVIGEWGGFDIWINNAAGLFVKPLVDTEDEDWHGLLAANLHGYFYGCRAAARHFIPKSAGCILNVTSITDIQPTEGLGAYTTAKGAIVAMTRVWALELGKYGIRVNALAPGATETPLNTESWTDHVREIYRQRISLGRIAEPDEIADVAAFLVSDGARYITGQEILADGGMTINGNVGHRGS